MGPIVRAHELVDVDTLVDDGLDVVIAFDGLGVGGGGECYARYGRELLVQQTQLQVVGTKIMAPLRHAVRLVNRKQCDLTAFE